ncbi:MAG TPA: hypothetical protein VGF95_04435 [Solirubrobacteraceae bacterium]|jgi:hypothetical protein
MVGRTTRRRASTVARGFRGSKLAAALIVIPAITAAQPSGAFAAEQRGISATQRDISATRAYVVANYALAKASEARVELVKKKITGFKQALEGECLHVGKGSPQNSKGYKLSYELAGSIDAISYSTDAAPIRKFDLAVKGLRWSNATTTRLAHTYATDLSELSALKLPSVCSDVRAWVASDYQTVPEDTLKYDQHVEAIQLQGVPEQLLTPYLEADDRAIAQRTEKLEEKLLKTEENVGYNDWFALLKATSLNQ